MAGRYWLNGPLFSMRFVIAFLISAAVVAGCSRGEPPPQTNHKETEGFTFFDLGANSQYSHSVRRDLNQKLGPDAISQKNTIDLSIHQQGFLERHFPGLADLNRRLNWPPRQRVEHDTTRLIYRNARSVNAPFSKVELLFSDHSGKPLLFSISAGAEGAAIVETILKKYGPPKEFAWDEGEGRTQYWEKGKDVFLISSFKNRRNELEYLFCIYFAENLEEMLKIEEARRLAVEEERRKAGKSAF